MLDLGAGSLTEPDPTPNPIQTRWQPASRF